MADSAWKVALGTTQKSTAPWKALAVVALYALLTAVIPLLAPISFTLGLPLFDLFAGAVDPWYTAPLISLLPATLALIAMRAGLLTVNNSTLAFSALTSLVLTSIFGILDIGLLNWLPLVLAHSWISEGSSDFSATPELPEKSSRSIFQLGGGDRRKGAGSHRLMIDMMDDGLISIDRQGIILSANSAAEKMIGTTCQGHDITRFLTVLREPEFADLTALDRHRLETVIQRESSATLEVEFSLTGRGNDNDWVGVIRLSDNTDRAAQVAKLERLALHDSLTGLPNRVLLQDRIEQAIAIAGRRNEPMAVMLMDLNKFKQVNDTLGHHVGDLLLQAVGPRLSGPLRETDTLARLGGDEFAVALPAPTSREEAIEVAERLVESIVDPFIIEGMSLDLGVSIGVAMYPEHGVDGDTLMHNADMAMYKAKREQLGATMFDSGGNQRLTRRVKLQHQLRAAIDNGDLEVDYQPKVSTRSWEVTGFEALVRWQHPEFGLLSPKEFIPLAEHTGLIMPMTLAVINACLSAQRAWRHAGFDLSVAVNISPKWLQDKEFPRILRLLLENWHGRADRLILEIPEAAIMTNPSETTTILRHLREQGIELSLDDFCTGYSSLPVLQRLPIQELKIDQRFIGEMVKDQNAAIVVSAVIKLAHALKLRVVAEGVEDQSAAQWLGSLGSDELQGYHFGKPMRPDDVPNWIANSGQMRPDLITNTETRRDQYAPSTRIGESATI